MQSEESVDDGDAMLELQAHRTPQDTPALSELSEAALNRNACSTLVVVERVLYSVRHSNGERNNHPRGTGISGIADER